MRPPGDREWIKQTLAHRETGAVPYNFIFCPPARRLVARHFGTESIEDALQFPVRMNRPASPKPMYCSPTQFGPTVVDEFGVVWSTSDLDRGSPIGPPLAEPTLAGYRWPDPAAPSRFSHLGDWCQANAGHFTVLWVGDLWERATFLRGMEHVLTDLALEPAFLEALLRGITDYLLATLDQLFARFQFDAVALSDDYGMQTGMLMSPQAWRRFIRPRLAEIYARVKAAGRVIFHHSCGNIYPIIGDLIDLGLDILDPIQPEAMDVRQLKRDFGRHLTFSGGVGTMELLPNGTPEQIRQEVRQLKRDLGAGGGFILAPGITPQADVPEENLVALIEAARQSS